MSNNTGIYKIVCIVTIDDYVGSAIKLSRREYDHFRDLKNGTHYNKKLQRDYDKYGSDNFIFEIIEYVEDKNNLIAREQYYIDTLKPTYNVLKIAGSTLGFKHSEESLHRMSESHKGNKAWLGKNHTEETLHKLSETMKGNKNMLGKTHSEITKLKIGESLSRSFKLLSPGGKIFEGINIRKFCRENNLHQGNICAVINNRQKSCKGWTKVI